jgi:hypothetical protein
MRVTEKMKANRILPVALRGDGAERFNTTTRKWNVYQKSRKSNKFGNRVEDFDFNT